MPKQPAFLANLFNQASNVTGFGDATDLVSAYNVLFDRYTTDSAYDQGGNVSTGTILSPPQAFAGGLSGQNTTVFTAPVAGIYFFTLQLRCLNLGTTNHELISTIYRRPVGAVGPGSDTAVAYQIFNPSADVSADFQVTTTISGYCKCALGDKIYCFLVVYGHDTVNNISLCAGGSTAHFCSFAGHLVA